MDEIEVKMFVLKLKFFSPVDVSCLPSEVSSSSVLPKKREERMKSEKVKGSKEKKNYKYGNFLVLISSLMPAIQHSLDNLSDKEICS